MVLAVQVPLPSYQLAVVSEGDVHHQNDVSDDGSVSSTLTVERLNGTKKCLSDVDEEVSVSARKKKKTVTFDLDRNVQYDVPYITHEELHQRWYEARAYREFKLHAKDSAGQIVQIELRNRAPYSYQRVLESTFAACVNNTIDDESSEILPASDMVHVVRWVEVASSRCGLEKWALQNVSKDRSLRRRLLTNTVLSIQDQELSRMDANDSSSSLSSLSSMLVDSDNEEMMAAAKAPAANYRRNNRRTSMDETIRIACEKISRPSRLFATIMAQAMEQAEINTRHNHNNNNNRTNNSRNSNDLSSSSSVMSETQ